MNFAERLVIDQLETIKRKPRVGDLVVLADPNRTPGVVWLVEKVLTDVYDRPDLLGVVNYEHQGRPNAFKPSEVLVLSAAETKAAKAHFAEIEENR